jgi:tetratricopeptide (TPR) repeat protein
VWLAGLLLAAPSFAPAQDESLLDRAERLADRGDAEAARQALAQWEREVGGRAPLAERARAWFLAGRLAEEGAAAELNYLRVVIDGSTTPYADDALLRLAQYKHAQGEYARALEYLEQLRRDYPTSEHRVAALLWISKSASALGDAESACAAVERGLRELAAGDTLLQRAFREERAACGAALRTYSVQVAAFREAAAAQSLARELLERGFDAWVLEATPRDPLYRVRVGRGLIEAEAEALAERLVRAGYSPFLVSRAADAKEAR